MKTLFLRILTPIIGMLLLWSILISLSFGQKRSIAITIDDLPFVGEGKNFHLDMIINTLTEQEVPATGFVIAQEVNKNNWPMLHKFHDVGLSIGNHTYSHLNLNKVNLDAYIKEIDAADKILAPILTEPKYFRYPYLAVSKGEKKKQVLNFLHSRNYHVAPITIDSKDFMFNQLLYAVPEKERRGFLKSLSACYLEFIWRQTLQAEAHDHIANTAQRAQILLIHANLLNAYVLPDIIKMYRQNGFNFISLEEALHSFAPETKMVIAKKNPPKIDDNYVEWD